MILERQGLAPETHERKNMRRRRYQKGSLGRRKHGEYFVWVGQWWDNGTRHSKVLGRCDAVSKSEALKEMAKILYPINNDQCERSREPITLGEFVTTVYIPLHKSGRWKESTAWTSAERISHHIVAGELGNAQLQTLKRDPLQQFLDNKAAAGLSFSVVAHLRWDLRAIFRLAVHEGFVTRNVAELLFTPRNAARSERPVLTYEEVQKCLMTLDLRERLIAMLAIFSGLRPGEIFGLTVGQVKDTFVEIRHRVYRGKLDSPKTPKSRRSAAVPDQTRALLRQWIEFLPNRTADAWLFPSEKGSTPLSKDNCWRRHFLTRLENVGLKWVNFQVMRRTHSSISDRQGVNPKVRADQMGHGLDVNLEVYTQTGLDQRLEAVNQVENAVLRPLME
jgi:integrase